MIADCSYCGLLELNEVSFFADVAALSVLVVPGVIVFTLWRMLVTNKQQAVVLGLDRSVSLHPALIPQEVSVYLRVLYLMTSMITFVVGLLASDVVKALITPY